MGILQNVMLQYYWDHTQCRSCQLSPFILALIIFFTGAIPRPSAVFGEGSGPVVFHNVACSGSESSLVHCPSETERRSDICLHSQDAGVTYLCTRYKKMYTHAQCTKYGALLLQAVPLEMLG